MNYTKPVSSSIFNGYLTEKEGIPPLFFIALYQKISRHHLMISIGSFFF